MVENFLTKIFLSVSLFCHETHPYELGVILRAEKRMSFIFDLVAIQVGKVLEL